MTDAEVGEIWRRAQIGWRKYADEQELQMLQLIRKLVEERARSGQSEEAFRSIAKRWQRQRLENACTAFGISWKELEEAND